jgi:hypothetical protein
MIDGDRNMFWLEFFPNLVKDPEKEMEFFFMMIYADSQKFLDTPFFFPNIYYTLHIL